MKHKIFNRTKSHVFFDITSERFRFLIIVILDLKVQTSCTFSRNSAKNTRFLIKFSDNFLKFLWSFLNRFRIFLLLHDEISALHHNYYATFYEVETINYAAFYEFFLKIYAPLYEIKWIWYDPPYEVKSKTYEELTWLMVPKYAAPRKNTRLKWAVPRLFGLFRGFFGISAAFWICTRLVTRGLPPRTIWLSTSYGSA